jgi:CheY-like chemotaxis protein/anti-sigma regulatory factor (Ser/Thr protein kinase)
MYQAKILTVDDASDDLEILNHILNKSNYETISAKNGREALDLLASQKDVDLIVLDRMMPVMDGLSFLRRLQENQEYSQIPVIMQTAADKDYEITQGVEAGVYCYITKSFSHQVLLSIVQSALRAQKKQRKLNEITDYYVKRRKSLKSGMTKLKSMDFEFSTLAEAGDVANTICCSFKEPRKIYGACLELLVNAVEHGNLGISFEEKTNLILEGKWHDEIEYRQKLKENINKKVHVKLTNHEEYLTLKIKDDGKGFDPTPFLTLQPNRAEKPNGRGIYLAGLEFDKIEYIGTGNEVICYKII